MLKIRIFLSFSNSNSEILSRIALLENLIQKVVSGEKPVVNFKFDPKLTKELTLLLYKWILCAHLYLHHREIQKMIEQNGDINSEELSTIVEALEPQKVSRR